MLNRGAAVARDEIEGVIQALVRWKTPDAMRLYARMAPEQYATYVDIAARADATSPATAPAGMPEIDPQQVVAEHEQALLVLDNEARAAQRA